MRFWLCLIAGAALASALIPSTARADAHPLLKRNTPAVNPGHDQDATLDEYRAHLTALSDLVDACSKARDAKSCDPELVGGNDLIPLGDGANAERRPIRYDWLRLLLLKAQKPDEPVEKPKPVIEPQQSTVQLLVRQPQPPTSQLLESAKKRLAYDLAQIDGKQVAPDPHPAERAGLRKILSGRDFAGLEDQTPTDTYLEKFGNWINKFFRFLGSVTAGASWIGLAVKIGFIVLVCVGLVLGLLQLERRWRVRLTPELSGMPAPGAASARDWQLWLKDARSSASAGQYSARVSCTSRRGRCPQAGAGLVDGQL
jgi:hypothetical protein